MPSTFSTSLRIELIGEGEQSGVWGTTTNNNLGDLIEQAITGTTNLNVTAGNITLTSLNGLVDEARSATLYVFGTPGVTRVLTIPNVYKNYTVQNVTANIVQVKTASGTAFDCPPLSHSYINCDESNVVTGRSITTGANTITSSAAPFNSPAFTGVPTAPTAAQGTNTTQLATTAFVNTEIAADTANLAPLASPAFTGVPTAPTAAVTTNTTQLATTAFVNAEIANDAPAKDGTGASGTWGINITGNAATVTNGVYNNGGTYGINISGNAATATNATNATNAGNASTATALQTARTINGVSFNGTANITVTSNTTNAITFNNSGAGVGSGSNFNGGSALTVSYNTIGAPSTTGANASGTWGISVTGSAGSAGTWTTARTLWGNSVNGSGDISNALRPSGGSASIPAFSSSSATSTGMYIPSGGVIEMSATGNRCASITQLEFYIGFQNTSANVVSSGGWVFVEQGRRAIQSNTLGSSNIDMYRSSDGTMFNFLRSGAGVGGITVNASSTTYSTSSDYRLKKDVTPLSGALAKLCNLNPVAWKWKATDKPGEGFIAHELAETFPQAVVGAKDAVDAEGKPVYQGVDSSFLVAALVASVKELSAKVDQLQAELAALKG